MSRYIVPVAKEILAQKENKIADCIKLFKHFFNSFHSVLSTVPTLVLVWILYFFQSYHRQVLLSIPVVSVFQDALFPL
jgi:hypothetical protein